MSFSIMRNAEGYFDPTAGEALKNIMQNSERMQKRMESITKRGEIYYIEKNASETDVPEKGKPVLIVSNDRNNATSDYVEIIYLTSQTRFDQPTHVKVYSSGRESTALCEQIFTVNKRRLGDYIGECTEAEMQRVEMALLISLGIDLRQPQKEEKTATEPARQTSDANVELFAEKIKLQTENARLSAQLDVYKDLYNSLLAQVTGRSDA